MVKRTGHGILNWSEGNRFRLLENGEEYFPRLFEAIDAARTEILVETFIWLEDEIGVEFSDRLQRAARRGVAVTVTLDGFGTPALSTGFLAKLKVAGVEVRIFDQQPSVLWIRANLFCRLHRKLVAIDGKVAFVGGINICADHMRRFGSESKQDYAGEVSGPVVAEIRRCMQHFPRDRRAPWWKRSRLWIRRWARLAYDSRTDSLALFATRDNQRHSTDIEALQRLAIRNARHDITIANAYFFPGFRFVRDLIRASKRGVTVRLVMQGKPDLPTTVMFASVLYDDLIRAGVQIFQFTERPMHAKVAVIDDAWATIGSSNLDPSSLGFNFEANLFILDRDFNHTLKASLDRLIERSCRRYEVGSPHFSSFRRLIAGAAFFLTREMSTWGKRFLRRKQHVAAI